MHGLDPFKDSKRGSKADRRPNEVLALGSSRTGIERRQADVEFLHRLE